eukprot:TRINITY_DN2699_c0_g1_i1.p1 TRINITY_DN2699_c0_g1~~TRINITY_DN2699_c0_g1_i1.p1  ORF type:complete len:201 (-),score=48.30 TRINITY_DN2699_c0_g1_i1:62-622(-)
MVKYSQEPGVTAKSSKARAYDVRTHFKNTRETVNVIRGMQVRKATRYLRDVLSHKRCVPYRYQSGCGRTAQAKEFGHNQGRWPRKSVEAVIALLRNAISNAEVKGIDVRTLYISHIQANRAQKQRRRTYRAHGRINPYMSSPSHIEVILTSRERPVKPPAAKKDDKKGDKKADKKSEKKSDKKELK